MTTLRFRPSFIDIAEAIELCSGGGDVTEADALGYIRAALADGRLRFRGPLSLQGTALDTLDGASSTVLETRPGAVFLRRDGGEDVVPAGTSRTRIVVHAQDLLARLAESGSTAAALQVEPKRRGGRPATAIPPEIMLKASAWLAYEGLSEERGTKAKVERKIHDLLAAADLSAGETTVRRCAGWVIDEHRRASSEGP
jgi:hypothetical protein